MSIKNIDQLVESPILSDKIEVVANRISHENLNDYKGQLEMNIKILLGMLGLLMGLVCWIFQESNSSINKLQETTAQLDKTVAVNTEVARTSQEKLHALAKRADELDDKITLLTVPELKQ